MDTNTKPSLGHLITNTTRCLNQRLRHIRDAALKITPLSSKLIAQMCSDESTWKAQGVTAVRKTGETFCVLVICLLGELLIWCLSLGLRFLKLQFLSAIVGMIVVFAFMVTLSKFCGFAEGFYTRRIKSKVDFINKNLGIGFPVPIVAISKEESLGAQGIGKVIGNFFTTNAIFWAAVFFLAWGCLAGTLHSSLRSSSSSVAEKHSTSTEPDKPQGSSRPISDLPPRVELPAQTFGRERRPSAPPSPRGSMLEYLADNEAGLKPESRTALSYSPQCRYLAPHPGPLIERTSHRSDSQFEHPRHQQQVDGQWLDTLSSSYPILVSAFCLIAVGIPVSRQTGDDRILDGCMLWFIWISAGRLQAVLSNPNLISKTSRIRRFLNSLMVVPLTLLNQVLITILLMMGYTRAKAAAMDKPLAEMLATFSSGTTLSDLWSHSVGKYTLKKHQRNSFGAGDAALAILECGIVVWGFKLYECRTQLASRAGLVVILVSAASAALNVFSSTLLGKAIGLAPPESLAFAARCTTLALARPAMEALGGNQVVNASLVVGNGIWGQLLYPFALRRLGVGHDEPDDDRAEGGERKTDDARTIAVGTAVGINGAAMGVSYLYQRNSRAAPYAVLSMTVFGIMTVVFTAVQPFTGTLKGLVA